MATLNVQETGGLGASAKELTFAAAATPSDFSNDGRTFLHVKVGGTTTNLTITSQKCSHGRSADLVFNALTINKEYTFGPFPPELFNDANGKVNFSLSSVTAITWAAVKPS